MIEDEPKLPEGWQHAWEAKDPSTDFADSLMEKISENEAHAEEKVPGKESEALPIWFRMLAAAALLLSVFGGYLWLNSSEGRLIATARQSQDIGRRGIAVAEVGAKLSWNTSVFGEASVVQDAGDVFYRVHSGGDFRIHTPHGNLSVRGTCFRVEVLEMNKQANTLKTKVRAAAMGAMLSAAVVVSVYEGGVVLANDHGEVTAKAGEQVVLSRAEAPVVVDNGSAQSEESNRKRGGEGSESVGTGFPPGTLAGEGAPGKMSYVQLKKAYAEQQQELHALRSVVEESKKGFKFNNNEIYPASPQRLADLAKRCGVQADTADLFESEWKALSPERVDALGLSEEEKTAYEESGKALHERTIEVLRKSYIDLGGDPESIGLLTPGALFQLIGDMEQDGDHPFVRLSKERAGLIPPRGPDEPIGPLEESMRWVAQLGDHLQSSLADKLGAKRAHELRAKNSGWPGGRSTWAGCKK